MEQNQQNQNQQFKCTGDCLNCRAINDRRLQWQYCAAQFTYNSMRMIESLQASMNAMAGTIEELKAKVNAIQDSEAMVFDVVNTEGTDDASRTESTEKAEGAEKVESTEGVPAVIPHP